MSVEFRVGEDEVPPNPITPHSILTDLVNLPDPLIMSLIVAIYNYDGVQLWMRVDGWDAAWSFTTNNLGALGSGLNMTRRLDAFGSRPKPAAETTETINVRLRAYTDAGYTNLKWTYTRTIEVLFIKSDDGSWTVYYDNDFDDGTLQGWSGAGEAGNVGGFSIAVANDFVLSPPWSARAQIALANAGENRFRMSKDITTPNRNRVYGILNVRLSTTEPAHDYCKHVLVRQGAGNQILFDGQPYTASASDDIPRNTWLRIVVALTKNMTFNLQIAFDYYDDGWGGTVRAWQDDFLVISKD